MVETPFQFETFLGIDNTSDLAASRIIGKGIYLFEADNVDIDDNGKIHRRDGYVEQLLNSATVHSLWADGDLALYVDNNVLFKLDRDLNPVGLIYGVDPTDRMSYVRVFQEVYFANNSIVGYIVNGFPYPFPEPNKHFKIKMLGGHILEYYNNRLYASQGPNLIYSDATVLKQMDKRKNALAFPGHITMVKSVADGLYVSAGEHTIFCKGTGPQDFTYTQVMDSGAVDGTAISVDGDDIGKGKYQGKTVYFIADGTIYKGLPGGLVTQLQDGLFFMDNLERGAAILKYDHGYSQYVAICELTPGIGGASGEFSVPSPSME